VRKSHSPLFIKKLSAFWNSQFITRKIRPQFDSIGSGLSILKPQSLQIFGHDIHAGDNLHIICSTHKPVNLNTWSSKQAQGRIDIGNNVLIAPGVTISSACGIRIADNAMIAAEVYISDSDWHGTYNRTRPFRCSKEVTIAKNAWIGYRAIIGKGIHIGENSIVAAGAVVCEDVADNCIVGGNPAKLIKTINVNRRMLSREFLFRDPDFYTKNQSELDAYLLAHNSLSDYVRASLFPNNND
jgi:acetyltransferase-like isoleucine patch superfamily enzyme